MAELKPTNPKDAIGSDKLPLHLWPETATMLGCLALLDGALKYGRSNFRAIGVRSSIYYDAARRHLNAWFEGEDSDPDSGLPHLAHALACIAVVVDAQAAERLNDDRMVKGGYRALATQLTPHVKRLKAQHADKSPKHYTISDDLEHAHGSEAREHIPSVGAQAPELGGVPHEASQHISGRPGRRLVLGSNDRFVGGVEIPRTPEALYDGDQYFDLGVAGRVAS